MAAGHSLLKPLTRSEVSSAARTTSSTSATLNLPQGSIYEWILTVTAASGSVDTSGALDVGIQISPDNGTTFYNTGPNFAQINETQGAAGTQDIIRVQPGIRSSDAGAEWQASTTGPIVQNSILTPKYRIRWTIAGAGAPSFTFQVWLLVQPKGSQAA